MPVIPYPNPVKALHQVNRHQVERRPGWELLVVRDAIGTTVVSEWVQGLISSLANAAQTAKRFEGFPGQRTSSDG